MKSRLFFKFLLTGMFLISFNAFSKENISRKKSNNCFVHVQIETKAGKKLERIFSSFEKNKKACQKITKLHNTNFAPNSTEKKTVRMEWIKIREEK